MAKRRRRAPKKEHVPWHIIGHWSFLAGILICVIAAIFPVTNWVRITLLFSLGIIVGLLNITAKETTQFLLATVALILSGVVNLGVIPFVGLFIRSVLSNIVVFVVPGAIIVGLKTIWALANDR